MGDDQLPSGWARPGAGRRDFVRAVPVVRRFRLESAVLALVSQAAGGNSARPLEVACQNSFCADLQMPVSIRSPSCRMWMRAAPVMRLSVPVLTPKLLNGEDASNVTMFFDLSSNHCTGS